jgi:hypothetical protein
VGGKGQGQDGAEPGECSFKASLGSIVKSFLSEWLSGIVTRTKPGWFPQLVISLKPGIIFGGGGELCISPSRGDFPKV